MKEEYRRTDTTQLTMSADPAFPPARCPGCQAEIEEVYIDSRRTDRWTVSYEDHDFIGQKKVREVEFPPRCVYCGHNVYDALKQKGIEV